MMHRLRREDPCDVPFLSENAEGKKIDSPPYYSESHGDQENKQYTGPVLRALAYPVHSVASVVIKIMMTKLTLLNEKLC